MFVEPDADERVTYLVGACSYQQAWEWLAAVEQQWAELHCLDEDLRGYRKADPHSARDTAQILHPGKRVQTCRTLRFPHLTASVAE
ncbi:hypothetical protein [Streptomyces sp. NPDC006335]|uniref:hypothetical protein n=1 Tax=Streptomyces sp. NPDC006335 TaxID=3156895 RepID=UPI0033A918EF